MTERQFFEALKQHDIEWIRLFMELAKQYKEASPEHKEKALEMLRRNKGYSINMGRRKRT